MPQFKKKFLYLLSTIKNLRNNFYGVIRREEETDDQSIFFIISDINPYVEMTSWYSLTPKIMYKRGSTNTVANPLSRIQKKIISKRELDVSEQSNSDQDTQLPAKRSFENLPEETRKQLNQFKQ